VISMASSMVAHVKPHAFGLGGIQDHEDTKYFGSNPRFFCGASFLGPLALDNVMMDILGDHILGLANDGNLVRFSTWLKLFHYNFTM